MSSKTYYSYHLAEWLIQTEWHFTTLLAALITSTRYLPDNADSLINQLIVTFPSKPASAEIIESFIKNNPLVNEWYLKNLKRPQIIHINLSLVENSYPTIDHLPRLFNSTDLAQWLGLSAHHLNWFADNYRSNTSKSNALRHYTYSIAIKRNGSCRLIESPKSNLKQIQRKISHQIITQLPIHDAAFGFVAGKNCKDHASIHTNKAFLYLFDIAHFFQSITWKQVYRVFMKTGYSANITQYLTNLCTHTCYQHEYLQQLDSDHRHRLYQRHAPQGAPSSPPISNALLFHLDKRLTNLAKSCGMVYSRYADDLAFSSNYFRQLSRFELYVASICIDEGFQLNHRKSRLFKSHQRQKITGIIVNEKLNIDRRYYDRLKAVLTNCARYGAHNQNRTGHTDFYSHLRGSINHVRSLNEAKANTLEHLFQKIEWP